MRRAASRLAQGAIALVVLATQAKAKEVIPPAPADHFHDYAGVASPDTADCLEDSLAQFERETSKHLVMVVYPKMQSDAYVGDYARRVFQSWGLGADSAVFFVFLQDKKTFLIAGDGLRSAFRDDTFIGLSRRVMAVPLNDSEYDTGLSLGVDGLMSAVRDQQGTAQTFWSMLLVLPLGAMTVWRFRKTT
ncbi:MAG TPA: TPM domain-containing protein [Chthoniobacterales bacterium]